MIWLRRILTVAIIVGLGWLFLSPVTLRLEGTGDVISCQPLGWGVAEEVSLLSSPVEDQDAIERYLVETGVADDASVSNELVDQAEANVAQYCSDARQNRQSALLVGLALSLALLVVWRTRRAREAGQGFFDPVVASAGADDSGVDPEPRAPKERWPRL